MKKYKVQIRTGKSKHSNFREDHKVVHTMVDAKDRAAYLKYHYPSTDIRVVIEHYQLVKTEILK